MDSSRVLLGVGCGALVALLAVSVSAADGDGAWSWRWISARPAGHTLQAIASDGALVVAAGRGPNLLVSGDGGRWVAVGERWQRPAAAVVGASGETPQLVELPTTEVPWGLWIGRTAGRWVITLSPHDLLLTSEDGHSWQRVQTGLGIDPHVAFGSATELFVLGRSGAVVRGTLQPQPRAPTGRRLEAPEVPNE